MFPVIGLAGNAGTKIPNARLLEVIILMLG